MVVNNALVATLSATELGGAFSPERFAYAGQMTLLGMLMVFAVLGILLVILSLFKVIFAKGEKAPSKKTVKKAEPKAMPTPAPAAAVAHAPAPKQQHTDEELVAILTAAIAAYIESEGLSESYAGGFRVVSFRRVGGGRSWNSK